MRNTITTLSPKTISIALAQAREHYVREMCAGPFQFDLLFRNLVAVGFRLSNEANRPGAFLEYYLLCARERRLIQQHPDFDEFRTYVLKFWRAPSAPFHFIRCIDEEDVWDIVYDVSTEMSVGRNAVMYDPVLNLALQAVVISLAISDADKSVASLKEDYVRVIWEAKSELDRQEIDAIEQAIMPGGL